MAKGSKQMALMDVDDPKLKAIRECISEYEEVKGENKEERSAMTEKEKEKRLAIFQAIEKAKIKADAGGVYHIPIDGYIYDIKQEAQLQINRHKAPAEEKEKLDGGLERKNAPDSGGKEPKPEPRTSRD